MASQSAKDRAAFAVCSRLLSCLVTESLLRAFYLPLHLSSGFKGFVVVLSTNILSEGLTITRSLREDDVFALFPVKNAPVLNIRMVQKHGIPVTLLDPLDMHHPILVLDEDDGPALDTELIALKEHILSCLLPPPWQLGGSDSVSVVKTPDKLWRKFVSNMIISDSLRTAIEKELMSSFYWQALAYSNPPNCPPLSAEPIEWEQSLVEGHPTHPMHRTRMLPLELPPDYDWYHPLVRFASVPRQSLATLGQFESEIAVLVNLAAKKAGKSVVLDKGRMIMPVHELQVPTVLSKFEGIEMLDEDINIRALAQASIRTVVFPDLPGKALKLAINVKISSSLRTISHYTANFGPSFSEHIVPKLCINPNVLTVELETASSVFRTPNPDDAKHFTAVFRQQYVPRQGETVIVCAALLETGHPGIPEGVSVVEHLFKLNTQPKRAAFVDRYIRLACEALVPALMHNGVAFEAHSQNMLARFDIETGDLLGFVIRDLGGLRIHPETLVKSTGVEFEFLDGHCVVTQTLAETYPKFYHTLVHNHLQRLIRLLGMHYDGSGYALLRRHLAAQIPSDHPLYNEWLHSDADTVLGKCLMRMRLQGVYRDMVYSPFPNMIQYRPQGERTT